MIQSFHQNTTVMLAHRMLSSACAPLSFEPPGTCGNTVGRSRVWTETGPSAVDQTRPFNSVPANVRSWRKLPIGLIETDNGQSVQSRFQHHRQRCRKLAFVRIGRHFLISRAARIPTHPCTFGSGRSCMRGTLDSGSRVRQKYAARATVFSCPSAKVSRTV